MTEREKRYRPGATTPLQLGERRIMTCIVCPTGCQLEVSRRTTGELAITGFKCRRGEGYARTEATDPRRVLTTTVRIQGGTLPLLPVRTEKAIPRGLLTEAMQVLARMEAKAPVKTGDVIVPDLLGTGIAVIASRDMGVAAKAS